MPEPQWILVGARFHGVVVDRLVEGARACLLGHGVPPSALVVERVAGAWELPQAASAWSRSRPRPDGLVALGCVVRGETPHFEYVCREASRGLMDVALRSELPMGFGLLTCDTMDQALARAGGDHGDKGWEAAEAAWDLAQSMRRAAGTERPASSS